MGQSIREMIAEVREVNTAVGWRAEPKTLGDFAALLHSEVAEALEAFRDYRLADATMPDEVTGIAGVGTARGYTKRPAKPEGVGSELADFVIRLFDTCDVRSFHVWDLDMELADVPPCGANVVRAYDLVTFGDWMAWLHRHIVRFQDERDGAPLLRAVVTVAERFGFDLTFEYTRKIAYNRTRPYQHGGRTVADAPAGGA